MRQKRSRSCRSSAGAPAGPREPIAIAPLRAGQLEDVTAGEHGVEWGEDLHSLLEAAMRQPAANLESLARSLTREREGNQGRVDALVASARAVQQSEIWARARASQRVLVEVPLLMQGPSGDSLPSVHRGVIDLVFREPNGWVIVDYKTDLVEPRLSSPPWSNTIAPRSKATPTHGERCNQSRCMRSGSSLRG